MSILLQNLSAAFVAPTKKDESGKEVPAPDGKYHLLVKGDLVGHSELQDDLIKHIFNATSSEAHVVPTVGTDGASHSTFAMEFTADEDEVADLIAARNANRTTQKTALGRSYSDVAADAALQEELKAAQAREEAASKEAASDGSAQDSASAPTGAADSDNASN